MNVENNAGESFAILSHSIAMVRSDYGISYKITITSGVEEHACNLCGTI